MKVDEHLGRIRRSYYQHGDFQSILKAVANFQKLDSQIFSHDYLLVQKIKMGTKFKKVTMLT